MTWGPGSPLLCQEESYPDRLVRTLQEISDGETSITQGDTELRLALAKTEMPEDMQKALVEMQPATRARNRAIAAKLLELCGDLSGRSAQVESSHQLKAALERGA